MEVIRQTLVIDENLRDLSDSRKRELCDLLYTAMEGNMWFFLELQLLAPSNSQVKDLAIKAGASESEWKITNARHVPVAAAVLTEVQPAKKLIIQLNGHEGTSPVEMQDLLQIVAMNFRGEFIYDLRESHRSDSQDDDALLR